MKISKPTKKQESTLLKQENINIPILYLKGLYLTQAFESILFHLLQYIVSSTKLAVLKQTNGVIHYSPKKLDPNKVTLSKIYERLSVYLCDNKYSKLMKLIRIAMEKRNIYVHTAFKSDGHSFLSLKENKYYLNKGSQDKLNDWLKAFNEAIIELQKMDAELVKLKSL